MYLILPVNKPTPLISKASGYIAERFKSYSTVRYHGLPTTVIFKTTEITATWKY